MKYFKNYKTTLIYAFPWTNKNGLNRDDVGNEEKLSSTKQISLN